MYISQKVAERIKDTLKSKQTNMKVMLSELNMGINTVSELAKGKQLSYISLAKIADYLDCSVDFLLGRADEPNSIFGELKSIPQVSDIELLYDSLDSEDKTEIRGIINGMLLADKYKHIPCSTTNEV